MTSFRHEPRGEERDQDELVILVEELPGARDRMETLDPDGADVTA
ncbi:MAG: hypothetical protein ACLFV8_02155 [Alphaproteobacteria bacterium]